MFVEERREQILKWILEESSITLEELKKRLKISMMSIYRDLHALEKQHKILRVRGGAIKDRYNSIPF